MLKPLLASFALLSSVALAGTITSPVDAMLTGATVLTFDNFAAGDYTSLQLDANVRASGQFAIGNDYAGQYNTRGAAYLDNRQGDSSSVEFHFDSPVSAVGFHWGAADSAWTLEARDSDGVILESLTLTPTFESNEGEFFGLYVDSPSIATLRLSTDTYDYVFVDNLTYAPGAPIPEPATTAAGFGLATLGLAYWLRRRRI